VYEIMQLQHGDASDKVYSIDAEYSFMRYHYRLFVSLLGHDKTIEGEIAAKVLVTCMRFLVIFNLKCISNLNC